VFSYTRERCIEVQYCFRPVIRMKKREKIRETKHRRAWIVAEVSAASTTMIDRQL